MNESFYQNPVPEETPVTPDTTEDFQEQRPETAPMEQGAEQQAREETAIPQTPVYGQQPYGGYPNGNGQPVYGQPTPTYGQQPVYPQYVPYYRPKKEKKKNGNGWKAVIAVFSICALCLSVFGGVILSSDLRQKSENGGSVAAFLFPSRDGAVSDPGEITDLQNSEYSSIADIAEDVGKSVVTIVTQIGSNNTMDNFGDSYSGEALGSGVIIGEQDDELYIATNFHVINGATDVSVLMGENNTHACTAYYKGSDAQSDLAVIYIRKSETDPELLKEIRIATLGESDDLKVGDLSIAIGSPVNKTYSNTVTAGIISGLERSVTFVDSETKISNTLILLQTDAAINPGNSGGALVNGRGEVIGINDAKIVSSDVEGMGFAIPISGAKEVLESLITNGKVIRPYLGIVGNTIDPASEFASAYGLLNGIYVQTVTPGLSADKAGMQANDVIISFNGVKVEKFTDLTETLAACQIGQTVEVTVIRGYMEGTAQTITLTLTIEEKPGDFD